MRSGTGSLGTSAKNGPSLLISMLGISKVCTVPVNRINACSRPSSLVPSASRNGGFNVP